MSAALLPQAGAARPRLGLLLLLSLSLHRGAVAKELKFVTLVFRHGDRSPIETFPNDPIKEASWPQGFGQLTQLGMEQHYELGQYIKKRYGKFLNESYKREQVYIQSTDVDRTLMSAMTNLAGLFPPEGISIWNPSLPWQPIPVHTLSLSEDRLLYLPFRDCPRFKELTEETLKSEEFQKRLHPYKDFIETLPTLTGYHTQDLFGMWTKVYDPLFCESVHNFTLPSWATEDTMTKLKELSELSILSIYGIHKQKEKSRLQGGVLVSEILNHMKIATQPSNHRKLIMYSAHDTTVSGLQMALDVYNGILPPYASCHIMELYLEKGEYFVEMYYRNETQHEPYPLTLPGCTPSCPLTEFAELVAPVIPQDWSTECMTTSNDQGHSSHTRRPPK
ncbi:prostatic acid phosphatase isoform X2 [Canis lupus baileyi]|uniref:prostatic acid phosphatase isoform X2 n=1 Tax=Canis lupus familiaris TaxID=9615 RepID=UPI0015F1821E|nr:prostatic acid phosphatase isoform X2 [Canis lupus familiaris]XP_038313176.1 prostatic acid phosphatase isoform X2 [Canis lupus familiaris]XP_038426781.1 prostatic acid phosphatase isoform X2 [Canis lupus familiaris]